MKIQTVLYIFFFSCFEVNAQQHFSLNKCIDYAYKQNFDKKLEDISLKQCKNALVKSEKAIYPNLLGSFSKGINSGRSFDFE
jgi:outer membrane protein